MLIHTFEAAEPSLNLEELGQFNSPARELLKLFSSMMTSIVALFVLQS